MEMKNNNNNNNNKTSIAKAMLRKLEQPKQC